MKGILIGLGGVAVSACVAAGLSWYMDTSTSMYRYTSLDDVPKVQAVMVLGAALGPKGTLSPVLKERTDAAIALYRAGKAQKMLVTGDDSTMGHDEVSAVRRYLEGTDIPPADIFLDHAGFDTYSSMYRARDIFAVESVIIVSQGFHLPRALFIARTLGLTAYGLEVGNRDEYMHSIVREFPARIKAVWDLLRGRTPRFLGEVHAISGSGVPTWYDAATTTPDGAVI